MNECLKKLRGRAVQAAATASATAPKWKHARGVEGAARRLCDWSPVDREVRSEVNGQGGEVRGKWRARLLGVLQVRVRTSAFIFSGRKPLGAIEQRGGILLSQHFNKIIQAMLRETLGRQG